MCPQPTYPPHTEGIYCLNVLLFLYVEWLQRGSVFFFLNCTFFIELWQIILRQMGKDPLSTAENS